MGKKKIVVIEDEPDILEVLSYNLKREGFDVFTAGDGHRGLSLVRKETPDLVLLDLMLPGMDGVEICGAIKKDPQTQGTLIIMVTAKGEESDIVLGLGVGADDYITKPFNAREIVARVRALLRRSHFAQSAPPAQLRLGVLQLDLDQRALTIDGKGVDLTRTEFTLLHLLMANPGHTFTRDELLEKSMGYAYEGMGRTLDTHMSNLRKKIEPDPSAPIYIQTVYGVGYRMVKEA